MHAPQMQGLAIHAKRMYGVDRVFRFLRGFEKSKRIFLYLLLLNDDQRINTLSPNPPSSSASIPVRRYTNTSILKIQTGDSQIPEHGSTLGSRYTWYPPISQSNSEVPENRKLGGRHPVSWVGGRTIIGWLDRIGTVAGVFLWFLGFQLE